MTTGKKGIFLDTFFIQALLNRRDHFHVKAKALFHQVMSNPEVWTTEAVLIEVGNALASINRKGAAEFITSCYNTPNLQVVPLNTPLIDRALKLYASRPDKEWGLTDCISFVVMKDKRITLVLSADAHFKQAGFSPML
jgi:hypothetical protein